APPRSTATARSPAPGTHAIRRLADLPFVLGDPLEVLALTVDRVEVDTAYAGFGHCRTAGVILEDRQGARIAVAEPRVLALHSADDGPPAPDDVELEFVLDDLEPGAAITAPLSAFLS